jgi:hypothetical protein
VAASLILPDGGLDVVCYACTSGSVVMGEDVVRAELSKGCPCAIPTTLVSGVFAALEALDVKKVVVAAPYLDEVNRIEADYTHPDKAPGKYEIVLQMWKYVNYRKNKQREFIDSKFIEISNTVTYTI